MGAIVGAVLGAIGGLLGEGFGRFLRHISGSEELPKWPRLVGVALALGLIGPVTKYINKPTPERYMQELKEKEPVYADIQKYAPDVYENIKSAIADSINNGEAAASIRLKIQKEIMVMYGRKLPYASDENLQLAVKLVRDETRILGTTNPALCVQMLSGQGADLSTALSDEIKNRDYALTTRIVSEPSQTSSTKASEAEVQQFITQAAGNISKTLNIPIQDVAAALQGSGTDRLKCQVSSELMDEFTKLPPQTMGPIYRAAMLSK